MTIEELKAAVSGESAQDLFDLLLGEEALLTLAPEILDLVEAASKWHNCTGGDLAHVALERSIDAFDRKLASL